MKVLHTNILIRQNAMSTVPKQVPNWQVDVYSEKFGDAVTIGDEVAIDLDALPEVAEEHQRMLGIFESDPDTKQSYVEIVYGRGPRGRAALEQAMQDAVVPVLGAVPTLRRRRRAAAEDAPTAPAPTSDTDLQAALAGAGEQTEKDPLAS